MAENALLGLLLWLWVVPATLFSGDFLLRFFKISWVNAYQRFAFAGAFGLAAWCFVLFLVGWGIAYTQAVASFITGLFTLLAVFGASGIVFQAPPVTENNNPFALAAGLVLFIALFVTFLSSFAPPADMGDALAYHLNVPKQWIQAGKIIALPMDVNGSFPMLINTGFGFGLMFGSTSFSHLLGFWIGVLCAAGVYGWASEKVSKSYALLGTAALLLTPAVYNHWNVPYVDIALSLFVLLAVWGFCCWAKSGNSVWIALSGCACGLALGTKYLAILYGLILAAAIIVESLRKRLAWTKVLRLLLIFGFSALALSWFWYWRNYLAMGNPVYPFMAKFFGGRPTSVEWQLAERTYGMGYDIRHLLTLFWDATFHPQAYAGFGTRWNLLFIGLLPLVLLMAFKRKGGWLLVIAPAILLSWFYLSQIMRFLMVFFPLYCVLLAWAAAALENQKPLLRRMVWTWMLAVCLWELACLGAHALPKIKGGWNAAAREAYLRHKEPTYAMAQWINSNMPNNAIIVSDSEVRLFYIQPATLREPTLRLFTRYPELHATPQETLQWLKQQGVTHVLISERQWESADSSVLAHHPHRLRNMMGDTDLVKLLTEENFDSPDEKIRYRVYALL